MRQAMWVLAAVAAVAPSVAFGGPGKAAPKTATCPVMNSKVDVAKATARKMFADYKGNRYYFCCGMCPSQFAKDPAKFAKAHTGVPIPKG